MVWYDLLFRKDSLLVVYVLHVSRRRRVAEIFPKNRMYTCLISVTHLWKCVNHTGLVYPSYIDLDPLYVVVKHWSTRKTSSISNDATKYPFTITYIYVKADSYSMRTICQKNITSVCNILDLGVCSFYARTWRISSIQIPPQAHIHCVELIWNTFPQRIASCTVASQNNV